MDNVVPFATPKLVEPTTPVDDAMSTRETARSRVRDALREAIKLVEEEWPSHGVDVSGIVILFAGFGGDDDFHSTLRMAGCTLMEAVGLIETCKSDLIMGG